MKPKKITMVNTGQIAKRGWKGLKTPQAVQNFATKHKVPHTYWKQPGTTQKYFLVEYDEFCDTWREWKKTSAKAVTRKPVTRKPINKTTAQRTQGSSTAKSSYRAKATYQTKTARKPVTRTAPKKRTTNYNAKTRITRR